MEKAEAVEEVSQSAAFDDVPIKSRYIEEVSKMGESAVVDLSNLKENQSINMTSNVYNEYEDRPIKAMKQ